MVRGRIYISAFWAWASSWPKVNCRLIVWGYYYGYDQFQILMHSSCERMAFSEEYPASGLSLSSCPSSCPFYQYQSSSMRISDPFCLSPSAYSPYQLINISSFLSWNALTISSYPSPSSCPPLSTIRISSSSASSIRICSFVDDMLADRSSSLKEECCCGFLAVRGERGRGMCRVGR